LVGALKEVLVVWFPCNDIGEARAKLGIPFVAGDLTPLEAETGINPETLIVEVPGEV